MDYNENVRQYLIGIARSNRRLVYYSTLAIECKLGLDFNNDLDRLKLSKILGDISSFELSQGRPLLSSVAYYKESNDHGDGFYRLCEELKLGKASKLKADFFGFTAAEACTDFWLNEQNYRSFALVENISILPIIPNASENHYFNHEELEFFQSWALKVYDRQDQAHIDAKNQLMATVWSKVSSIGAAVVDKLHGFDIKKGKYWSQPGWDKSGDVNKQAALVKPYAWVRIFRVEDRDKDIFFTLSIDTESEAFVYKLDYYVEKDSALNKEQKELFVSLQPAQLRWNEIPYDILLRLSFEQLVERMIDFIIDGTEMYDVIIDAVWRNVVPRDLMPQNGLIKRNPPAGISSLPAVSPSFNGIDVDWAQQHTNNLAIGNSGEALVIEHEKMLLKTRPELADKVKNVLDGEGYDILSYHPDGREKYIEVKTTDGGENTPFYLTLNELLFLKMNSQNYFLYRLYNHDSEKNAALFYVLDGEVENKLLLQPIQFKVYNKLL